MRHAPALLVAFVLATLATPATYAQPAKPAPAKPAAIKPPPATKPAPKAPPLRLDRNVVPTEYAVDLTLDPDKDTFTGTISIPVTVDHATKEIRLHGRDITVTSAVVSGGTSVIATTREEGEFLVLELPTAVGPGTATIRIDYSGKLPTDDVHGLFRQSDGGRNYLYSQFEATEARRAFPCFDEPSFKVPWQLTLHVPKGMVALSNTMPVKEKDDGGVHTVTFGKTKPLPSYLVALAVGPFDMVNVGKAGINKTPMRIAVPKGRALEARYAKKVSGELLAALEKYLGTPYPYPKLDSVAIPTFFGAMENPGLITYAASIILAKPSEETVEFQQGYAGTGAHEMAHQWFGDYVTMAWWDDIWLNESFADFMADRIVDDWKPAWGVRLHRLQSAQSAFTADSLISARKIHNPIKVHNDINGVFDPISYAKGGSVLAMYEAWVGRETFQKTLKEYLAAHAWGNASSQDFIGALAAASRPEVSKSFSTFLDQGGIPLVSLDVACTGDKAELVLSQERFLPLGSGGSTKQTWLVPMCVGVPKGKGTATQCFLLNEPTQRVAIDEPGCPAWVDGNVGGRGYYRVRYARDLDKQLLASTGIDTLSRAAALFNLRAMVEGGHQPMSDLLAVMPDVARDKNYELVTVAFELALGIQEYVDDDLHDRYLKFLGRTFSDTARTLGWKPKKGESAVASALRLQLVAVAALMVQDPALVAQAKKLAAAYAKNPRSMDPKLGAIALASATHGGDDALAKKLDGLFKKSDDKHFRGALLAGMVMSKDPAVRKQAIDRIGDGSLALEELFVLIFTSAVDPTSKAEVYGYVVDHLDQVIANLPFLVRPNIVRFAGFYCDAERRKALDTTFRVKVKDLPGGDKALAEAVESMDVCIAKRKAAGPDIAKFLSAQ